jgi:DNA repair exonuclease SbcCD ATPase subunit
MSFTVENFRDLIRLLEEHPEWRAELRRLVLSDELLRLPEVVARMEESLRTALEHLAQHVAELAQRQAQTEARLAELAQRVEELAQRQAETEVTLARLIERQSEMQAVLEHHTQRIDHLAALHADLRREVDELKGWALETRYERRLPSILGRVLRRAEVATPIAFLEAIEDRISEEAFEELRNADLLVRARLRADVQRTVWLVVEVSSAVDPNDVARAVRRAALLRQAGVLALPVVAGARVTAEAEALLAAQPVVRVQDGTVGGWEQALAHWETPPAND